MSIVTKTGTAEVSDDLEFILSDATPDRYGDVVEANGWDLAWFRKNPIALFGHDNDFPIGTWDNVRVEGGDMPKAPSAASVRQNIARRSRQAYEVASLARNIGPMWRQR